MALLDLDREERPLLPEQLKPAEQRLSRRSRSTRAFMRSRADAPAFIAQADDSEAMFGIVLKGV